MNIRVNFVALREGYEALTAQYKTMEQLLEKMKKQKFFLVDMDNSKERQELESFLRRMEKEMGTQLEFLRSMRLALEQILYSYEKGELSIYDYLEDDRKEQPDVRVEKMTTHQIKDVLDSLQV